MNPTEGSRRNKFIKIEKSLFRCGADLVALFLALCFDNNSFLIGDKGSSRIETYIWGFFVRRKLFSRKYDILEVRIVSFIS